MTATRCATRVLPALLLALSFLPGSVAAQRSPSLPDSAALNSRSALARYGKWLTLGGALGAATYGVLNNQEADNRYSELERICRDDPGRCARRPGGAYSDPALEARYQHVLHLDDRARTALIAGEISVLASVVLFVFDLPRGKSGEDIPYSPPRLQIKPEGERLLLSVRFGAGGG